MHRLARLCLRLTPARLASLSRRRQIRRVKSRLLGYVDGVGPQRFGADESGGGSFTFCTAQVGSVHCCCKTRPGVFRCSVHEE